VVAIDTNIIVRFLTGDNELQFQQSLELFKNHDIFIADTIILETEWVLRYAYSFKPADISEAFTRLFGLPNVHLSNSYLIAQAIQWHLEGLDFADALHLSQCQQYSQLFTFDKKFINKAKGLCKCLVLKP
jgi:predicted nucleic-acid-binding protein